VNVFFPCLSLNRRPSFEINFAARIQSKNGFNCVYSWW